MHMRTSLSNMSMPIAMTPVSTITPTPPTCITGTGTSTANYFERFEAVPVFSAASVPSCSTGSPAARHSATPSSNRLAR